MILFRGKNKDSSNMAQINIKIYSDYSVDFLKDLLDTYAFWEIRNYKHKRF